MSTATHQRAVRAILHEAAALPLGDRAAALRMCLQLTLQKIHDGEAWHLPRAKKSDEKEAGHAQ